MNRRLRVLLAIAWPVLLARTVGAQAPEPEAFTGVEFRSLRFDRLVGVTRLSQTAIPIGAVIPVGRFTVDIGSFWVDSRMTRSDGTQHSVDAFTDTQVRASYVFGRDAVVATVLLNLPTGLERATVKDYTVIGAISPNLLGFPVATYASGFSVTSGLAASLPAGDWSIGLAGSIRVNSKFTPYADLVGPLVYKPGVEGRVRGALDGLVGSSRLSVGVTYSTFGDDQFGSTSAVRGQYSPGPRWLAEAMLESPIGGSTLALSIWSFRRTAGDTTGGSARNRESLAAVEATMTIPLSRAVAFEPSLSGRVSKPELGKGRLLGVGGGLSIQLGERVTFTPSARFDTGWIEGEGGFRTDVKGGYLSGFIRVSF